MRARPDARSGSAKFIAPRNISEIAPFFVPFKPRPRPLSSFHLIPPLFRLIFLLSSLSLFFLPRRHRLKEKEENGRGKIKIKRKEER
jgi:hypothetical protein